MIIIKEVSYDNIFDVCELTTNKDGIGTTMEEFICCNAISIAESKYYSEMYPKAIYSGNTLIGFFMYKQTKAEQDIAVICRFMIDYKYQGKGLGRESFVAILSYFRQSEFKKIVLMIDENNIIAKKLYISFGFKFNGMIEKDEYYYELLL
ncbi:MAG: GNAT family N-acetyltransferase [Eubacterium sp.]|nr:GNAT family N-acetyltransferase [Eubacterium sp.]